MLLKSTYRIFKGQFWEAKPEGFKANKCLLQIFVPVRKKQKQNWNKLQCWEYKEKNGL